MKVDNGIWVVKVSYDYEWCTIYGRYKSLEQALVYCDLLEGDYEGYKVRWLKKGEMLPNTKYVYGI